MKEKSTKKKTKKKESSIITKEISKNKKKIDLVSDGVEFREKKQKQIKEGNFEFFRRSSQKNFMELPFDELVNSEFPKELNMFNIVKKRTYCNIMDLIIKYDNLIFNEYPEQEELIFTYLSLKWKIDKKFYKDKYDNKTDEIIERAEIGFRDDLYNQLFNRHFTDFIRKWVDIHYDLNIDDSNKEKENKNYNPVLQFSDKHCKMLQCISLGTKLSIPLILHFYAVYGVDTYSNPNSYLQRSFDYLFKIFGEEDDDGKSINLYSKLWESVYSRVVSTNNSDKTYWNYVEIEGTSIDSITESFYQKLIVDIIPKYELDKNLINLNHVFVKNNIDYTLRSNIDINYKPLNLAESEDDVSDWDKLSINTARIDEGIITINECNIQQTIKNIIKEKNIKISEDELDYYEKDFKINDIQKALLFNFFSKYLGSIETLYSSNKREYVILLIIMKHILEKDEFMILPKILTGTVNSINEKTTINKKYLVEIMNSEEYESLIKNSYSYTENNVKNVSSLIIKLVANIINNKFLLKEYNDKENEGEKIDIPNIYLLAEEILRFVSMI